MIDAKKDLAPALNAGVTPAVIEPTLAALASAAHYARSVCFQPFLSRRWVSLGVMAFLAWLWHGLSQPFVTGRQTWNPIGSAQQTLTEVSAMLRWTSEHFFVSMMLGMVVVPVLLGASVLLLWISSRGQIMFVRALMTGDSGVKSQWRASRAPGYSIFLFQFAFNGALFVLATSIFLLLLLQSMTLSDGGRMVFWTLLQSMYPILLLAAPMGLVFGVINFLLRDLVAPLMYEHDLTCMEAWSKLSRLTQGNMAKLAVFLLVRVGLYMILGIGTVIIFVLTCTIAFLPFVSQILLCPLYVFDRAFPVYFLSSLDPAWKSLPIVPKP